MVSETPYATIGFSVKFSIFISLGRLMKLNIALVTGAQTSWVRVGVYLTYERFSCHILEH